MYDALLKNVGKHITLSAEDTDYFLSLLVHKKLRKRQYLLQEGDVAKYESFVVKGCLRTYEIDDKGQEHVGQFSVEDWWVGDLYSFVSGKPSRLNIDCLEDSELLQISKESLDKLYDKVPEFNRFFRIMIQNAYIASTQRMLSSMAHPAIERYVAFINKYPNIEQRVPNHQIASFLGITPESLSRIRKQYAAPKS